ncbi:MAG: thioredoxin [Candidatus Obscuribacterales bacterium]|nr:thioredoxin [Candidatus Obscuribacterales bacterium]
MITAACLPACQAEDNAKAGQDSVLQVTDQSFEKEVLKSDKPVLVDFWAPWCGPCRRQGPIVEELSNELKGKVKVAKLNTDDNPKTAQAYNIRGIPCLIVFKSGKVADQMVGLRSKEELLQTINKHL